MTTITAEERARWRSRLNANSGLYNIHLKDMLHKALDALEIAEKELKAARTAVRECEEGWTNHCLEMERAAPLTKEDREILKKLTLQHWDIDEGDLSIYRHVDDQYVRLSEIDGPAETARELVHVWRIAPSLLAALEATEKEMKELQISVRECEEGWTNHSLEMERAAPLTKHGRATWWATIERHVQRGNAVGCAVGMKINATDVLRLLELIEAAEARANKAEEDVVRVESHRYKMAHVLAVKCHQKIKPGTNDLMYPEQFVTVEEWLEWVSHKDPCVVCEHLLNPNGGWCHLFEEKPKTIPCGQYAETLRG